MIYSIFTFLNNLVLSPVRASNESLRERFDDVTKTSGGEGEEAFIELVENIYNFAFPLAVFVSFVLLVYGAYKLITSGGDPDRLNEAREIITNAILGVLMIGLGIGVLYVIARGLGVPTSL